MRACNIVGLGFVFPKSYRLGQFEVSGQRESRAHLGGFDRKIKLEAEQERGIREIAVPLEVAVKGRTRFIEILNYLNSRLKGDKMWFTQIEPLNGGVSMPDNLGMGPFGKTIILPVAFHRM